jgi:hypothetical protein
MFAYDFAAQCYCMLQCQAVVCVTYSYQYINEFELGPRKARQAGPLYFM